LAVNAVASVVFAIVIIVRFTVMKRRLWKKKGEWLKSLYLGGLEGFRFPVSASFDPPFSSLSFLETGHFMLSCTLLF